MNRFELIVIRWDKYGDFKSRDRTQGHSLEFIENQFQEIIKRLRKQIEDEKVKRYPTTEDDDIPF